MEFSRPEHWSRLPLPSPGDLLDPGIEPASPALKADSLPLITLVPRHILNITVHIKKTGQLISVLEGIQKREKICGLAVLKSLMEQMGFEAD